MMAHRRILVINDFASRGGAEEVYQTTVRALTGIENVTVSTFDGSMVDVAESFSSRIWNRRAAQLLQAKLDAFKPDFIWVHNFQNFLSPSILVPLRKYKQSHSVAIVQTAHDFLPAFFTPDMMYFDGPEPRPVPVEDIGTLRALLTPSGAKGRVHDIIKKVHWLATQMFLSPRKIFDAYLCPSLFLLETLKRGGVERAMLFFNPVGNVPAVVQRSRPVGEAGLRLAFAGRLCYEKGIDAFLKLAQKINFEMIDTVTLYGDGPLAETFRREFSQLIASGKLVLAGRVPHAELPALLQQHDAMVLPSVWYENAPMVIPEAAASGLPILVRDLGSMSTYGREIGNKVLFASSADGLRAALEQLILQLAKSPAPVYDLSAVTQDSYVANTKRLLAEIGPIAA